MKILFVGDISLNNEIVDNVSKSFRLPFDKLDGIDKYDFVFANLESPVASSDEPVRKKITLKTTKEAVGELKKLNSNIVVGLANNHLLDYGVKGYNETISALDENRIEYFGVVDKKDYSICMDEKVVVIAECFNDTSPMNEYDNIKILYEEDAKRICQNIKRYKEQKYKVIIYIHWGIEFCRYPLKKQKEIARTFIDNGADCIIGHHPHIVQSYEKYKNKYIFYSLGNFLFADVISNKNEKTYYNHLLRSNKRSIGVALKIEEGELELANKKYYKITNDGQVISSNSIWDKICLEVFRIGNKFSLISIINIKAIKFVNYYHILISKIKYKDLNFKDLVGKILKGVIHEKK